MVKEGKRNPSFSRGFCLSLFFPPFFAKKEKKKQKPSSSFPSSLMGKYHGSQRCFLCNVDENPLRHTPQQYTGPELSSLAHHEDRKACRSCLAFTLEHIKVGNIALSPFFPLFSV